MVRALRVGVVPAVLVVVLLAGMSMSAVAAEGPARMLPDGAFFVVEVRSTSQFLDLLADWMKDVQALMNMNPLDEPYREVGRQLELDPADIPGELKKTRGGAVAFTGIDKENEVPCVVFIGDCGDSQVLKDAFKKKLTGPNSKVAETVREIPVYTAANADAGYLLEENFGCVVDSCVVIATRLEDVKAVIELAKGGNAKSLAASPAYVKALGAVNADSIATLYLDGQGLLKALRAMVPPGEKNEDLDKVISVSGLETIESAVAGLNRSKQGLVFVEATVLFSGDNRFYAAIRGDAAEQTAIRFIPSNFAFVGSAVIRDGKAQWEAFKELATTVEPSALKEIEDWENTLKIRIADEAANVVDAAWAVRVVPGAGAGEPQGQMLIVAKVKDPARIAAIMKTVEAKAVEGQDNLKVQEKDVDGVKVRFLPEGNDEYCWAIVDNYVLLGSHTGAIADAVRAWHDKKCILDDEGCKKALAGLHKPWSKMVLINPAGIDIGMPRNPNAPAAGGMIAATEVDQARRLDIRADLTNVPALVRTAVMTFMGVMGGGMVAPPPGP